MKAAVFREVNKPMEIEEVQVSKPGPREVLVRAVAVGVCHSDLHFFNGTYPGQLPIILGHEGVGGRLGGRRMQGSGNRSTPGAAISSREHGVPAGGRSTARSRSQASPGR